MQRLRCYVCGKEISSEVPRGTIIDGIIICHRCSYTCSNMGKIDKRYD